MSSFFRHSAAPSEAPSYQNSVPPSYYNQGPQGGDSGFQTSHQHGMPTQAQSYSGPGMVLANPRQLRFPQTISLFYKKGISWKFYLGQEKGQPIYALDMPMNEWGDVILCDGPDESSPQIAISKRESYIKGLVKFWLPPMGHGDQPICEELRLRGQMVTEKYTFAIPVGNGPNALPEKFEWKPAGLSKFPGMGSLAMTYELVRLSTGETVAKFTNGTSGGLRSKLASMEFLRAGASGELGNLFTLMTVMTFVRIWQRYFQSFGVLNAVTAGGASS